MVPTPQRSAAALVTRGAVTRATLASALVSLAAPGVGAFGVTQIFFVTGHSPAVFSTATLLLHLLSAGVTVSSVTPHGAGVFSTGQRSITGVSTGHHLLRAAQRALGFSAGTGPVDGARTGRTGAAVTYLLTGVVPTGQGHPTHLSAVPGGLSAGPLCFLSATDTALDTHSGTGCTL